MSSGRDAVGAATDAPDDAKIRAFRTSALRSTASDHGPTYWRSAAHRSQNAIVSVSLRSTSERPGKISGSAYANDKAIVVRSPSRSVNVDSSLSSRHAGLPAFQLSSATASDPQVATGIRPRQPNVPEPAP